MSGSENEKSVERIESCAIRFKSKKKDPPPETPESVRRRRLIILSFWIVIVTIGLPIWWNTTAIYRAKLPLDQMTDWANGKVCRPVFPLRISIQTDTLSVNDAQNLVKTTQHALDDLNDFPAHHLRLQLHPSNDSVTANDFSTGDAQEVALIIRLIPSTEIKASLHPYLSVLDIYYTSKQVPAGSSSSSPLTTYITNQLRALFSEERALISHLLSTSNIEQTTDYRTSDTLKKWTSHTMKYSPSYHLTFSLFTPTSTPTSWPIASALETYIHPLLKLLHPISDFSIDTQIQFYASPGISGPILRKEDLSLFINAAEWPLSPSIGGGPTINFIIFVGDMEVEGGAKSWLIPQWGGVVILSPSEIEDLQSAKLIFAKQLLSLLGAPETGSLPFRLQTLSRVLSASLLLKASSTLGSLARLSLALPSIAIPRSVADGVTKSITSLHAACEGLGGHKGLQHARSAEREAEKAFFEKSMVGQVYFPDEHKVAVYLPLLGPIGVPLAVGAFKEIRALIKGKTWTL
ncbi:GPI transamidase component PIG-S-like protein [Golovinomyces cichoracearum]|uniref:GPI transamidase component PIG-S-like protein n=1 Tax=Golovinomyces cichoracearum TaxID=62708 RepID=A0A420ICW4_9PEZI|nr:GPI transamidase component PIG-S-like protein [Golovinomyces cichoracearum]